MMNKNLLYAVTMLLSLTGLLHAEKGVLQSGYDFIQDAVGAHVVNIAESYTIKIKGSVGTDTLAPGQSAYVILPVGETMTVTAFDKQGQQVDQDNILRATKRDKLFEVNVGRFSKGVSVTPKIAISKLTGQQARQQYPEIFGIKVVQK